MKTWLRLETREEIEGRAAFLREGRTEGMKFWNSCLSCLPSKQENLKFPGFMGNKAELEVFSSTAPLAVGPCPAPAPVYTQTSLWLAPSLNLVKERLSRVLDHSGTQHWTPWMSGIPVLECWAQESHQPCSWDCCSSSSHRLWVKPPVGLCPFCWPWCNPCSKRCTSSAYCTGLN